MSPAQASTMSGSRSPSSVPAHGQIPAPARSGDRRLEVEPLQLGLLVDHDQVDVRRRAQAVVGHRQQTVRVRRQIDPGDLTPVGEHDLDQPRTLVGEPVVVVTPGRRGEQDVERGNPGPPGQPVRLLQPLAVLHGLGGADHGEGLVGGEESVPSGEGVALEPAVAVVLRQHLHHPTVGGTTSSGSTRSMNARSLRRRRRHPADCCWSRRG